MKTSLFGTKEPAYLIDSENVGSTWVSLLQSDEKFELFICVTENAKNLNFTLLKQLTGDDRRKINIIECKPGKNSLDFYLSSYLGYLIGKGRHSSYVVVSQDTGYDSVIEYWQSEGYDVKRINTKPETVRKPRRTGSRKNTAKVQEKPANSEVRVITKDTSRENLNHQNQKAPQAKKKTQAAPAKNELKQEEQFLQEILKDYSAEDLQGVRTYLNKVPEEKRSDRNYIYRGLVRKFKSEKGHEIYTLIKKDLDRYYELSDKQ